MTLILSGASSVSAQVNETVNMRFGKHDGYERLVFEWDGVAPDYKITRDNQTYQLTFDRAGRFNVLGVAGADSSLISTIDISAPNVLTVILNPYDDARDFKSGKKIVIDFYTASLSESGAATSASPANNVVPDLPDEPVQKVLAEKITPPVVEKKSEDAHKEEEHLNQPHEVEDAPKTVLEHIINDSNIMEPHVFILSLSESSLAASFERFGYVWFILDSPDIKFDPYIEGPSPEIFGEMKRFSVDDGRATAWRIKMPPGYHAYGEGGNILWRLVLSPSLDADGRTSMTPDIQSAEERITFSLGGGKRHFSVNDPVTGEEIQVITVEDSVPFIEQGREFVMLDILSSPIGITYIEKAPGIEVDLPSDRVVLSRDQGLELTKPNAVQKDMQAPEEHGRASFSETDVNDNHASLPDSSPPSSNEHKALSKHLFNFKEWQMGGGDVLEDNQNILLASLASLSDSAKAEKLMTLAKLNLAHGYGPEAIGYLDYAASILPQLRESPLYQALYGVAKEVSGQYLEALEKLFRPEFDAYPEIQLWKSSALANLGDWQQAVEMMPDDFSALNFATPALANPLTLRLAEIALKNGDTSLAEGLLLRLNPEKNELSSSEKNELNYLKGEVARQSGNEEEAEKVWTELTEGSDDLFRAKAELALVSLGQAQGKLPLDEAVERLDQLRYVWRGDDLEVQVLRKLGLTQIDNENYLSGLNTLRDTVVLSLNSSINSNITNLMMTTYKNIFLTDKLQTVSAAEAAMLYEEFRELTPAGTDGDKVVGRLADHLADSEFFERASELLEYQLEFRLQGVEAVKAATRLASIYLMNNQPEKALEKLNKAEAVLKTIQTAQKELLSRDIELLRARALADNKDVNAALTVLDRLSPPTSEVSRLKADIAWRNGRWYEAADALRTMILNEDFIEDAPLSNDQIQMLMNYAVTLNLSSNRAALGNLRERFLDKMQKTDKGDIFEVVTRPRQNTMISDRETIRSMIGETDIFGDFLDSYRAVN